MRTIEHVLRLPKPHANQKAVLDSKAKRKVIVTGRRAGKTTAAAIASMIIALKGRRILFAAPTMDQIEMFWEVCVDALADLIKRGVVYKNETKHLLVFPNGGRIRAKTAFNADTLRGDYADILILEEFAYMDIDAWDKVGAPMLLDNDGDAWFISSPNRRNHFFNMYTRAKADETGRWEAFHFTSHDNPHLSKEALAELTEDMTEEAYKQEIMAEFLESEGSTFKNVDACLYVPDPALVHPDRHRGHMIGFGLDWGRTEDATSLSVGCKDCAKELVLLRLKGMRYARQRQTVAEYYKRWKPGAFMAEANSMGQPNIEDMQDQGLNVTPFWTDNTKKAQIIETMMLDFQAERFQYIDEPVSRLELLAFETKMTRTGKPTYAAPEGTHDDTVIARALMRRALDTGGFNLYSG